MSDFENGESAGLRKPFRKGLSDYFADQGVQTLIAMRVEMGADEEDVKRDLAEKMGYTYSPNTEDVSL